MKVVKQGGGDFFELGLLFLMSVVGLPSGEHVRLKPHLVSLMPAKIIFTQ